MLRALTTLAVLAFPSVAFAADLVSDPPMDAPRTNIVSDPGWGLYVQGYGGIITQSFALGTDNFDEGGGEIFREPTSDWLNMGPAFGASIGVTTPIDGLSVGIDVMHTHSDFTVEPGGTLDTLSIMGTLEGAYHLSPQFDIYVSGGLGAMQFHYRNTVEDEDATSGFAPAYQVAVGARANLTENLSIFVEAKHQDIISGTDIAAIGEETATNSTITQRATNAILVGARFGF
jgi:opacity protein-like surface antigen